MPNIPSPLSGIPSPLGFMGSTSLFSPSVLFASDEPGIWYDPSDLTTVFTDTAGTTPATVGSTVALMLDKSGNDNHATQPTAAARPTLGRVPAGGRRNLLTYTEQFDNAAWLKVGISIAASAELNPVGVAQGVSRLSGTNGNLFQSVATIGVSQTVSFWVKSNGGGLDAFRLRIGASQSAVLTATSEWVRYTYSVPSPSSDVVSIRTDGVGSIDVLIWGAQLETGSTDTAYQKVVTAFDVTEAGVASKYYLSFDGVDDFMVTPTITPGTNKVQVFAGVRKQVDTTGCLTEMGTTGAQNGIFNLFAPLNSSGDSYRFASFGTSIAAAVAAGNVFPAPITNILTGLGDISGDRSTLRVDRTQIAQSIVDQGTGNYLAYPMYIGRRAGTALPFNGHIYSLITRFGPNLESNLINQSENYVAGKTGVTL